MTVPESAVTGSHLQPPVAEALWPTQIETQQESCIRCGSRKPLASERPPWAVLVARPCHSVAFQGQKAGELRSGWSAKPRGGGPQRPRWAWMPALTHLVCGRRGVRQHPGPAVTSSAPPRHAPHRTATLAHQRPRHGVTAA